MENFHPFPRLPFDLRIQIWGLAFEEDRVLQVRHGKHHGQGYIRSPSPVPAVTRASRESRMYCSYQQAFISGLLSNYYIWTKFDSDIVHITAITMSILAEKDSIRRNEIRHLRVVVGDENGVDWKGYTAEFFYYNYNRQFCNFPKLEAVDVLVADGLHSWGSFIEETHWGTCPMRNVRMVDVETGECIDEQSAGPYVDYQDNRSGEDITYQRIDDYYDEENEEDVAARYNAMIKIKEEPLPRIDLNYWDRSNKEDTASFARY